MLLRLAFHERSRGENSDYGALINIRGHTHGDNYNSTKNFSYHVILLFAASTIFFNYFSQYCILLSSLIKYNVAGQLSNFNAAQYIIRTSNKCKMNL